MPSSNKTYWNLDWNTNQQNNGKQLHMSKSFIYDIHLITFLNFTCLSYDNSIKLSPWHWATSNVNTEKVQACQSRQGQNLRMKLGLERFLGFRIMIKSKCLGWKHQT